MAVTININNLSLVHKSSSGIAKATLPDVCKTPSPGGPVPIPYPNIALSLNLAKGTKTVKVDGGNMAANKGSEFSISTGDEPGTQGGVKSGTNMKEATWLTYSFNVKMEGKNACRLSDKMLMNHGNTVCLGGENQPIVSIFSKSARKLAGKMNCEELAQKIDELVNRNKRLSGNQGTHGLKHRFAELNPETPTYKPHVDEIAKQQRSLNTYLDEYNQKGCGDPPEGAREWADRKIPVTTPETAPVPVTPPVSEGAKTAIRNLAIAGAAVGTGYIIYRAIRMIPSLFPPLWPTIPVNLAVP